MLTLVLLPGMDGTGTLFEPFITALGQDVAVQVVSYPAVDALGYSELEAHARHSLPSSGRFILLGESFSGPVAVAIAASRPPGLVGLVLCSTFVRNPRPAFGPLRHIASLLPVKLAPLPALSTLLLGRFSTPALRAAFAAAMSQVSAQALRARLRAVLDVDVSMQLGTIDVPMLYLLAQHDRVVPTKALKHIQRISPAVQVAPINAPHFLLQAAPAEAAQAVASFTQALQTTQREHTE
ncbi:alpha/beta hydrolase [Pseudomonas sp. MM211]|uniref:alpha/beta fold hydrolase n=1 Tax=Pseudomonas sp. MM211 TaxID=2866808 RepID=UPI001CED8410|nr:alpha/beta hydrolase [Pseudomonas sp. MM211]UCJ16029.1 alpha/beta hydrolase [Pseudomonas sp. MM211]